MPEITILNEAELRNAVKLDMNAIDCIENAFKLLATTAVEMPPILSMHIPEYNGEVDVKTAYVPGIPSFAVKMSPGFFDNPKLGLPSVNGLMVVFAAQTGLVEALLLDNGYLTDIRTAAAGAVAAKWLARKDAKTAGIVGAGTQARLQLRALTLVRDIEKAVIWARDPAKAEVCARECADALGIEVTVAPSLDVLAAISDIIVTTTPASEPILTKAHIRPGQHITAMGSDAPYKGELAPEVLTAADLYICDRYAQCMAQGELRRAVEAGVISADRKFAELSDVIIGESVGRQTAREITICDLTGMGVQDTAIAAEAVRITASQKAGSRFIS
ncbi:MAG: cyclodeaminase [Sneathiella sp.]